ncbi:MAG TPA: hypothetical protein VKQ36_14960 [Ktedonobacterales bacterium]|nr:hypothetical protein [Ktedonobacterales bacterium]
MARGSRSEHAEVNMRKPLRKSVVVVLIGAWLALAACGSGASTRTTNGDPPKGQAAAGALAYAATVNGGDSWVWRISVPHNRLLLYYWLTGDNGIGYPQYLGASNDTDLLAKIQQQSAVYQQLDPSHPVVSALDLVDPIIEPCSPTYAPYYNHAPNPSVIQHYITLAQQQHMLFFLDVNPGWEPVGQIVNQLWPYLQQPNVELAIDPEFDFVTSHACYGPGNVGQAFASEINPVIDRLSALVASGKLPPKMLVLYIWQWNMLPDWQSITLKPGVTVMTCVDGVGIPKDKIAEYNDFGAVKGIQYPAFKVFYNEPMEQPVMTPQQVLGLQPPPVMVEYQ